MRISIAAARRLKKWEEYLINEEFTNTYGTFYNKVEEIII